MASLRAVRIVLATIFFAACTACLLLGPQVHPMARAAAGVQIALSAFSVTAGVTFVWLLVTILFGRVYCGVVCPVGYFSDIFTRLGRRVRRRPFAYRHPSPVARHVMWVYFACVLLGLAGVPFLLEPWNIARNMASVAKPSAVDSTWLHVGLGTLTGILAGVVSAIFIALTSIWRGREFCTRICPVGTALGAVSERSVWHIEIDHDKCTACGRCEEICRSQCIKTVSRYVDNSRCVRCFDCTSVCPEGAVRFQPDRNRPANPLFRRTARKSSAS